MDRVKLCLLIACFTAFGCQEDNGLNGSGGSGGAGGVGGRGGVGGIGGANPFDTRVLDLRDFARFRIDQTEALTPGGCPVPYLVDPAAIERVGEGEYLLTFSRAFSSEEAYLDCLQRAEDWDDCDLASPVPGEPRTLSDADLEKLMDLFSSVSVSFAPNPCDEIGVDPCNIIRIQWDDLETSDQFCENPEPWTETAFARDVLEAVNELAPSPPE